jgi:hypothetical protein
MRVVIETDRGPKSSYWKVSPDDAGGGALWTPSPERALAYARDLVERFVVADLALRRDGCPQHVRVIEGTCPTCGLPAGDCVGVEL